MFDVTTKDEGSNRSVYFAAGDLERLDEMCAAEGGISRSLFVREMIADRWKKHLRSKKS